MNQAQFHLIVNHLPIIIPIVGFLVMIAGLFYKSHTIKRIAYSIFILGALCAIPAIATGEGAEEIVEKLPNVTEQYIKAHEEIAEIFAILMYVLGGISLVGFWANWKRVSYSNILSYVTVIFCVVVLFYAKQTGTSGGEIRHTEIRTASEFNSITPDLNSKKKGNEDGD